MKNIIGTKTSIKILSVLLRNPHKEFKEIELRGIHNFLIVSSG